MHTDDLDDLGDLDLGATQVIDTKVLLKSLPPLPGEWGYPCANCDAIFETRVIPPGQIRRHRLRAYCSPRCSDQAGAVRLARKNIAAHGLNRRLWPETERRAFRTKMALGLGEGYSRRELPECVKEAVRKRVDGLCEECGQPGAEVHHSNGDSEELTDLQYLCEDCHWDKTRDKFRRITDTARIAAADVLVARMLAAEPLRPCDDPEGWDWWLWCELSQPVPLDDAARASLELGYEG